MPSEAVQRRFDNLLDDIARLYRKVQKSLVETYWKIGYRIAEEEEDVGVLAEYGARLLKAVSEELLKKHQILFSSGSLGQIRDFYRMYPAPSTVLTWEQYVAAGKKTSALAAAKSLPPLKRPPDLRLRTFRKVDEALASLIASGWNFAQDPAEAERPGAVLLDCGFFTLRAVTPEEAARVTVTDKPAYTYHALVERVVDGDTLLAIIFTGFGGFVRERLRLRGINTPETKTPEGEKAKKFVEALLPAGTFLVIKSYKTDDYGRFVVDVMYKSGAASAEEIVTNGTYLNQQLLDEGYAVRMKE